MDWFMGKARRKDKEPNPSSNEETKQYLHGAMLECSSSEARLREIVNIAEGLDHNEWLASHTIAFFDHINLIYGTISEFCSPTGCPDMAGPCNRQYLWVDEKGKRIKLSAPQYVDYVMTFAQKAINDESIFPTKFDKEFPVTLEATVKKIMKLLYHVLAHIYHSHFREIVLLNLHPHLNCVFAHLVLFNERFHLIEEKEVEVLHDLAVALKLFPPDKCDSLTGEQQQQHPQELNTSGSSPNTTGMMSPMMIEDSDELSVSSATIRAGVGGGTSVVVTTQPSNDANNNLGGAVIRSELDDEMKENIVVNAPMSALSAASIGGGGGHTTSGVGGGGIGGQGNAAKRFNSNHNNNHHASPIKTIDLNAAATYAPSPMLVDEISEPNKFPMSPEPMLVESSDSPIVDSSLSDPLRDSRSISANVVLGQYGDGFGSQSPVTRRCNSDRSTGKTVN